MSKCVEPKIVYYEDELNDEFAGDSIEAKKIDINYRYIRRGLLDKVAHIFWYRIIATPLAFFYMKIHFHHRIVNKKALREVKGKGYFLYGNHTHNLADALIPTMVVIPNDAYVIVHPNNVSMPYLGKINPYLGALPLPGDFKAGKNFIKALDYIYGLNHCIMIYPEAHIWPFYTGIRPFKNDSFRYPVGYKCPVYCLTNTYQKRRHSDKPNLVTYIDGPFYPDESLSATEQRQKLRDDVYNTMKERAKNNSVCLIRYEKKQDD